MGNCTLTIIIITHNNAREILPCLHSLPWEDLSIEACIIDNHSRDATRNLIDQFRTAHPRYRIRCIWNGHNLGFARAVNLGLRLASGTYVMLLGSDARLLPGAARLLIQVLNENPQVGLAAPQIIDSKGNILDSCRRFPRYRDLLLELSGLPRIFRFHFLPSWKYPDFDHKTPMFVEQPEATCLMSRSGDIETIGGMDERFTMFFNDVDWCRRYIEAGMKVMFFPEARVEHRRGSSVYRNRIPMIWRSHQGFYRYFEKYATTLLQRCIDQLLGFLLIFTATFRSLGCLFSQSRDTNQILT